MVDKLILLDKVEKNLHTKLDPQMFPKPKKISYFDQIKSNLKNN